MRLAVKLRCRGFRCLLLALSLSTTVMSGEMFQAVPGHSTCCGRTICSCTHDRGMPCPVRLKQMKGIRSALESPPLPKERRPGHCSPHAGKQGTPSARDAVSAQPGQMDSSYGLRPAPCRKGRETAARPDAAIEYLLPDGGGPYASKNSNACVFISRIGMLISHGYPVFHPPERTSLLRPQTFSMF